MIDILNGDGVLKDTRDAEGNELDPPITLPGWHVNITTEYLADHPELEPFVVTPSKLRQVWAGDDEAAPAETVALVFPDGETGPAVLGIDEEAET